MKGERESGIGRALANRKLPPADVVPRPKLPTHRSVDPDRLEPDRFVKRDARRVRQRDPRASEEVALEVEDTEERPVERAADAGAAGGFRDVDRNVRRPLIRGARPVPVGIGVPEEITVSLADEPWPVRERLADSPPHLLERRRIQLERDRRSRHDRGVDCEDAGRVILRRDSNRCGHESTNVPEPARCARRCRSSSSLSSSHLSPGSLQTSPRERPRRSFQNIKTPRRSPQADFGP